MATAIKNNSIQQELFEPQTYLGQGPGYFAILYKDGQRQAHQVSYPLDALAPVIQTVNPAFDTWISQATFSAKNRRAVCLRDVGLLFADLDTYNFDGLRGRTPDQLATLFLGYCANEGLPPPSIILFSGRGLQVKWLLETAIDRGSILLWNDVQRALVHVLDGFGADRNARDVSRVLRLEKTVNTKSGELVRVVHTEPGPASGGLIKYDFETLAQALLPRLNPLTPQDKGQICLTQKVHPQDNGQTCANPQDKEHSRATPRQGVSGLSANALNWARLEDIRTLWRLRGGVVEGYRETTLFWSMNFLVMAAPVPDAQFWYESRALASEIYPGDFWRESDLSTVYRKAQEYRAGSRVIYQGRMYPPLYTPKNETLAEAFRIEPEEEQHLQTIISQTEKVRRRREKRWADGARPHAESAERTRPWEALGMSRATWYRKGCPK